MKRKIAVLIYSFLFLSHSLISQVNPHAIGLRLNSDGHYGGAEISYQHGFGDANRLELDFGGRNHKNWKHFGVFAGYHWVWNLTDGLNWYIGPGAALGFYDEKFENNGWEDDGLTLAIGGQIGLEYDFSAKAPILISFDARPLWEFWEYDDYNSFGYGGAFSIRYVF